MAALTQDTVISRSEAAHNDFYDYSNLVYVRQDVKVEIICPLHGSFWQLPMHHMRGIGCMLCGREVTALSRRSSFEKFSRDSSEFHAGKYDYSRVDYKNNRTKVEIVCPDHGSFFQTPDHHVCRSGCPACAKTGFDPKKQGVLYILQCDDILKIGITNNTAKSRATRVSKSAGKKFSVMSFIKFQSGQVTSNIETRVIRWLRENAVGSPDKFEGSSECFTGVDYTTLLSIVTEETLKEFARIPLVHKVI